MHDAVEKIELTLYFTDSQVQTHDVIEYEWKHYQGTGVLEISATLRTGQTLKAFACAFQAIATPPKAEDSCKVTKS